MPGVCRRFHLGRFGWAVPALLALGLTAGCKQGAEISRSTEAAQPEAPEESPPATAQEDAAATDSAAARQLEAEVPEFLLPVVEADARRELAGVAAVSERWPAVEGRILAYYRSTKMLARAARQEPWATSPAIEQQIDDMMLSEYRRRLFEKFVGSPKITDAEIEEYYQENIEEFQTEGEFVIRHIFLDVVNNPGLEQKKEQDARKALAELKAGEPFVEVAKRYSDVEGPKGEKLQPLPFGEINPKLEKAITTLKPGRITDVVKSKWGYNIFRLESIEPPTTKPLELVRSEIESQLYARERKQNYDRFQKELERRYPLQVKNFEALGNPEASNDVIVAKGDFITITLGDFRKRLLQLPPSAMAQAQNPENRLMMLNSWIDKARLRYAAKQTGLANDPQLRAIAQYLEERALAYGYLNQLRREVPEPTDEEVRQYYQDNREQLFTRPDEVRLREIVISFKVTTGTAHDRYKAWKAAEETAKEVVKKLEEGADFVQLVRQYSVAGTKENDGDIGFVVPARKGRAFAEAVKGLEIGEWSQPIKDERTRSFRIVRVEERKEGEVVPLDAQMMEKIRENLRREKWRHFFVQVRIALAERYEEGISATEIRTILDTLEV